MGAFSFRLPDVGEGIAEAEIVAWHVGVGEIVTEDQPLVDVMTDKATVEIGAPVAGKILARKGEVGGRAAVGAATQSWQGRPDLVLDASFWDLSASLAAWSAFSTRAWPSRSTTTALAPSAEQTIRVTPRSLTVWAIAPLASAWNSTAIRATVAAQVESARDDVGLTFM